MTVGRNTAWKSMERNIELCIEKETGLINYTKLAEITFFELQPNNKGEIPQKYFDWALSFGNQHEIKSGARKPNLRHNLGGFVNSYGSDFSCKPE